MKLGFTGVCIIFLISAKKNINCGYSLETPRRGGSNEYHNLCFEQKYEKYQILLSEKFQFITKTRLFKYTENFTTKKMAIFQIKNSDICHIYAQNIDCGYSLEPPRRGGSNEYPQSRNKKNNVYPCKPQFYYIKVWFKGVKII